MSFINSSVSGTSLCSFVCIVTPDGFCRIFGREFVEQEASQNWQHMIRHKVGRLPTEDSVSERQADREVEKIEHALLEIGISDPAERAKAYRRIGWFANSLAEDSQRGGGT